MTTNARNRAKRPEPKAERLETLSQARSWDTNKNGLTRLGMCYGCACQGAWGRQIGFARVRKPCAKCRKLLETLPAEVIESLGGTAGRWLAGKIGDGEEKTFVPPVRRPSTVVLPADVVTPYLHDDVARRRALRNGDGTGFCVTCRAWWGGASTCHCPTCHETLSSDQLFVRHQAGGVCHDPRTMRFHGHPLKQVRRGGVMLWQSGAPRGDISYRE